MNHHSIPEAQSPLTGRDTCDSLSAYETKALLDQPGIADRWVLMDVRTAIEFLECRLPGAALMPLDRLPLAIGSLDRAKSHLVYARTERDALTACELLAGNGIRSAYLAGGIVEWMQQRYPITCG
jgi:rhodanese-related sulfurtransferase